MQRDGCWVRGWLVGGSVLRPRLLPASCAGPQLEEYGVCPQSMSFLRQDLLRLVSKPSCDGTSYVHGVCLLLPDLVLARLEVVVEDEGRWRQAQKIRRTFL